jgi:hypothetical protein
MLDARNVQLKVHQTSAAAAGVQRKKKKSNLLLVWPSGFQTLAAVHLSQTFPLSALWWGSRGQDALFDPVLDS